MTNLIPLFHAARQAADLCARVQQTAVFRSEKSGQEPVTIADYGAQAILCRALMRHFPDDPVIAEESGAQFADLVSPEDRAQIAALVSDVIGEPVDQNALIAWLDHNRAVDASANRAPRAWLIDPVDGTKGFLALRHYVVAVGMLMDGEPTGAVVAAPIYPGGGRLFYAVDGASYSLPLRGSLDHGAEAARMRVSSRADIPLARAMESAEESHVSHDRLARARGLAGLDEARVEQADSQEKYCRVAAGDAELYLRLPRKHSTRPHMIWDHAPGVALVRGAGGIVTDIDGSPLDFTLGRTLARNQGVIATNGQIHDALIEAVGRLLALEQAESGSSAGL